jgi:hypothetical protein
MSSSQSSFRTRKRSIKTINNKKSSVYDRDFKQNLINYDVYPEEYEHSNKRETLMPNN